MTLSPSNTFVTHAIILEYMDISMRYGLLGPAGLLIVRGLKGFRRRSMLGAGPMPTGRRTPLGCECTAVKVVA